MHVRSLHGHKSDSRGSCIKCFFIVDSLAAQGDSEISGTAIETSYIVTLRITVRPKAKLPMSLKNVQFPLGETPSVSHASSALLVHKTLLTPLSDCGFFSSSSGVHDPRIRLQQLLEPTSSSVNDWDGRRRPEFSIQRGFQPYSRLPYGCLHSS